MNIVIGNLQPSPERAPTVGWRDASRQPLLKQGAVFTATLVERTDDYARLATADGAGFTAKSDSVKGEVGDLLSFEVVKSGKRLTLRQIAARDDSRASLRKDAPPIDELIESKKTIDKIKDEDVRFAEEKQEEQEKIAKAIAIITRAQSYVESNAGKSAAAAIVESGLSVSKIGFATLERVMRESGNVKTPELSEDEIIKSGVDRGIARSLLGRGLPAVSKNAELLEKVFDRIPPGLPDASVARLVAEGNPITLEKIYVGRYASPDGRFAGSVEPEPSDGDLDGQIKRYFADNGIEETRSSIEAARLLVKNDLPLDGGNVELAEILRNLRAHVSKEAAYALAAEAIIRDENPSGILLSELVGLSERMREAEIMLKFTNDAAARLYETDISVETGPQREALAKLYELNDEAFGKFLRVAGAADDESNAAKMGAVYERISELFPLTANAHVSVIKGEIPFTIEGVRGAVLYARALEGYGANETVPDPRRGDSFKKVSDSFAPFLSGIGIAPTAENIKAGFILSKNEMDVSWENIVKVKEIDLKINEIAETLRPEIAASMLKDGLSPLEMHADQVIAYIRQFGKDYGFGTGEKISKCIVEMDEGKKWDAETRKRAVAVYRMLYVIQKDGAASLGLAAKSGEPLTLGALMELSKYFDKARHDESVFDKAVGDAYGRLERLSWPEESIRRLLELPEKPAKPHDYVDLVIEKFADAAKPERLVELLNKLSGGEDVALEDVRRAVIPGERHTEEEYRAIIAELAVIYQASPRTLSFLLGRRIAAAPGAVREAERSKKPRFVSEALESLEDATAKKIFGALPDYGSLSRGEPASPSHVYAQILAKLDAAIADAKTSGEISAIEAAKQAVSLRYALGSKTEFRIPVQINGATADLQVLVLDRDALTGDSVRAAVLLETKSFGALRFVFEIDGDSIAVEAGAASPEAMTRLRVRGGLYERLLAEAGFAEVKINFAMLGKADEAGPEKDEPETLTVRELSEYEFVV